MSSKKRHNVSSHASVPQYIGGKPEDLLINKVIFNLGRNIIRKILVFL